MTTRRGDCAVVEVGGKIYVLGGNDGRNDLDTVECYDIEKGRWTELESRMNEPRCGCAAVAISDKIYVAGGWGYGGPSETVEVYDIRTDAWMFFATMSTVRANCTGAAVGDEFFVFGGEDDTQWPNCPLDMGEGFNVKTKERRVLPDRRTRNNHDSAAAVIGEQIYVVGGYVGGRVSLDSVDVFDTKTWTWTELANPMKTKRSGCAAVAVGNRLFVCGGYTFGETHTETEAHASVEVYDVDKETWTILPPMASKRWGCAAIELGGTVYVMGGDGHSAEEMNISDDALRRILLGWSGDISTWRSGVAPILHWRTSVVPKMDIHSTVMPTLLSRVGQENRIWTMFGIVRETISLFRHTGSPDETECC